MSPSEFDLRAALREGEGEGRPPSADRIIADAERLRRHRRARYTQMAAAAMVVGLIGVGGLTLGRGGSNGTGGAGGGSTAQDSGALRGAGSYGDSQYAAGEGTAKDGTARGSAGSSGSAGAVSAPSASSAAGSVGACPGVAPRLAVPGGGGTGQFGGDGKLFAEPVTALTVCAYRSASATAPTRAIAFTGPAATAIADALETADVTPAVVPCPTTAPGAAPDPVVLVFVAQGRQGRHLDPVVETLGSCHAMVTNGTAVRYDPDLPASVARLARG